MQPKKWEIQLYVSVFSCWIVSDLGVLGIARIVSGTGRCEHHEWYSRSKTRNSKFFLHEHSLIFFPFCFQALDTGNEFEFSENDSKDNALLSHSFAYVLIGLIQSLPTSLVPYSLFDRCARVADRDEAFEVKLLLFLTQLLSIQVAFSKGRL